MLSQRLTELGRNHVRVQPRDQSRWTPAVRPGAR
jgi:hypothetical protein